MGDLIDYNAIVNGRGRNYGSFPIYMDTNKYYIMQRYRLNSMPWLGRSSTLTFITDSINTNAAFNGIFFVGGYDVLPISCHGRLGAQCDIEVYNHMEDDVTIHALSSDAWKFTITGKDLGELVWYRTAPGGANMRSAFTTWMDTEHFNYMQRYRLLPIPCDGISVIYTFIAHNTRYCPSIGPSFIDEYGTLPLSCHNEKSAK